MLCAVLGLTDHVEKKSLHVSAYIYFRYQIMLRAQIHQMCRSRVRCFSYTDAATSTGTWMHRVSVHVKGRHSQIELSPFLPRIIFLMPCCRLWYVHRAETHAGRLTRGSGAGRYSQINKSGPWRGSVITVRGLWYLLWNLVFLSGKMDGGYLPKLHYLLRQPTAERIIIMSSENISLGMTDDAPERKIQVLFFLIFSTYVHHLHCSFPVLAC